MSKTSSLYKAQEKQNLFHYSTADETLYGGAAGGGKSYAIIWDAVTFCLTNDKVSAAIFRRTYPELDKSVIPDALKYVPANLFTYNKSEHRFYFKNGSFIEFNHCEFDEDVRKYQSAQYDRMYFDELTSFSEYIYKFLQSRCRTTNPNVRPQIKCASNPGNVGHVWVKRRFIDGAVPFKDTVRTEEETQHTYTTRFIPAKVYDNKYLMENDPGYVNRLKNLSPSERKMLLDGDWYAFDGQFFKEFTYSSHVIEPFEIPHHWTKIRCLDWGYTNPYVCLWIAFATEETAFCRKGDAIVYKELQGKETTDANLAAAILNITAKNENISYTVADPSLWSINQSERGESIAMRLMYNGVPLVKGDNNRKAGASLVHQYLFHDPKVPAKLKIFETCTYLIKTLPTLIHSKKDPEDCDTKGDDHGYDALRYGLMTKPIFKKMADAKAPYDSFAYWMLRKQAARDKKQYAGNF